MKEKNFYFVYLLMIVCIKLKINYVIHYKYIIYIFKTFYIIYNHYYIYICLCIYFYTFIFLIYISYILYYKYYTTDRTEQIIIDGKMIKILCSKSNWNKSISPWTHSVSVYININLLIANGINYSFVYRKRSDLTYNLPSSIYTYYL